MKFTFSDFKSLAPLKALLIEKNDNLVPFFIISISVRSDGKAIVALDGVNTENQAAGLNNCRVYLQNKFLPKPKVDKLDLVSIKGYRVTDTQYGEIGILEDIIENPGNRLLLIKHPEGKEILIPAIPKIIVKKIDNDSLIIQIDAPNGLIDLYISDNQNEDDQEIDY